MASDLTRFRTELDVHARFNERGMQEAKKSIYAKEIKLSNAIQTATESQFALRPLEVGFVQSLALKDDPKFKEIQKIYAKYNAEVAETGQHAVAGLHLKTVVMEAMLKFIRIILLAADTPTKKTLLDLSYYWFIKHLNPRSQRKPKTELHREIRQIVTENRLLPRETLDKELPSEQVKDQLHEYRVKARTCYTDIDAPAFELENYHIHKVAYMNDKPQRTDDDPESRRLKRLFRVEYKKPNLEQYYIPHQEQVKEQQPEQLPPPPVLVQGEVKAEGLVPPQPALTPEQEQMELLMNQMGGQPEEPEEAPPEEDEDKKRGKLDPLVKVFLLKQQRQKEKKKQKEFEYPPIGQLERLKGNYKEQVQREDDDLKGHMIDWAAKRSRFKTQANRKMQSMRAFKDMSATRVPHKVQDKMYHTRINQAVRDGRSYIKGDINKQPLNTEAGLSCFDRRRIKTSSAPETSSPKPFSQILEENKRINKREEFLDEIQDIKIKFAKQKIFTSMNAMRGGLMHPQEKEEGEELERVEYPTCLLSNPFFVVKKKKKKGKKKK